MHIVVAIALGVIYFMPNSVQCNVAVTKLNDANFEEFVHQYEVVMVNFYADWCRFCQMLKPVYEQAAVLLGDSVNARLVAVDCEAADTQQQKAIHGISKYPTLKIFRNGMVLRQEYRGQRSAVAIEKYIRELLEPPVKEVTNDQEIVDMIKIHHKAVIGIFPERSHPSFSNFQELANVLRDTCHFAAKFEGDAPHLSMRTLADQHVYDGDIGNGDQLLRWAKEECTPLVREITFTNGEELTEEGLPFIIMFYDPNDLHSVQQFSRVARNHFEEYRGRVNFITADGHKFTHPLQHLGKTKKDLPILAADTFRHMFLFKNFKRIHHLNVFKKFIDDVLSGALHVQLHNPVAISTPDPYADEYNDYEDEQEPEDYLDLGRKETIKEKLEDAKEMKMDSLKAAETVQQAETESKRMAREYESRRRRASEHAAEPEEGEGEDHRPVAVKSVMGRLRPSDNRYSILKNRDEL
eukprot:gene5226-8828_t